MTGASLFKGADLKTVTNKGELKLAQRLSNDYTIEFNYQGDQTDVEGAGLQPVFKLVGIRLYPKSPNAIKLSDAPATDDGRSLWQSSFAWSTHVETLAGSSDGRRISSQVLSMNELKALVQIAAPEPASPASPQPLYEHARKVDVLTYLSSIRDRASASDQSKIDELKGSVTDVKIPLRLSGPLLERLMRWLTWIQYLTPAELRAAHTDSDLRSLWIKGVRRSVFNYLKKVVTKQTSKTLIIAGVILATRWNLSKSPVPIPGKSLLKAVTQNMGPSEEKKKGHHTYTAAKRVSRFSRLLSRVDPNWQRISAQIMLELVSPRLPEKKNSESFKNLISLLTNEEAISNGTAVHSLVNEEFSALADERTSPDDGNAEIILVSEFRNSGKIALTILPGSEDSTDPIDTLVVDKKTSPQLFEKLQRRVSYLQDSKRQSSLSSK